MNAVPMSMLKHRRHELVADLTFNGFLTVGYHHAGCRHRQCHVFWLAHAEAQGALPMTGRRINPCSVSP